MDLATARGVYAYNTTTVREVRTLRVKGNRPVVGVLLGWSEMLKIVFCIF